MVLEKSYETVARWGNDKWIIEAKPQYRWTDIKGRVITDWFNTFDQALEFLINRPHGQSGSGTRNQMLYKNNTFLPP